MSKWLFVLLHFSVSKEYNEQLLYLLVAPQWVLYIVLDHNFLQIFDAFVKIFQLVLSFQLFVNSLHFILFSYFFIVHYALKFNLAIKVYAISLWLHKVENFMDVFVNTFELFFVNLFHLLPRKLFQWRDRLVDGILEHELLLGQSFIFTEISFVFKSAHLYYY